MKPIADMDEDELRELTIRSHATLRENDLIPIVIIGVSADGQRGGVAAPPGTSDALLQRALDLAANSPKK